MKRAIDTAPSVWFNTRTMTNTNPIDPAAYRAAVRALDIAWANLAAARAADMRDNSPATLAAHIAAIAARDIALETLRNTRAPRY